MAGPPTAIDVQGNDIRVRVGNRGSQTAANVKVSVWYREWPKDADPPTWQDGAGWTQCDPAESDRQSIRRRPGANVRPVHAQCANDAIHRPGAGNLRRRSREYRPRSQVTVQFLETSLRDVVAGDNNLALRVLKQN